MRGALLYVLIIGLAVGSMHGQFSPDGGSAGSTALHRDSVAWSGWAESGILEPGPIAIAKPELGLVPACPGEAIAGAADDIVCSLGDGGSATLRFEPPIVDGDGPDFAVFENGFAQTDSTGFYELAFVEVSADGTTYVRFPATSLTRSAVGSFDLLDPRSIDGLAGKSSAAYGVPFDLSDLPPDTAVDGQAITHVRIVDVVGSPDSAFAKTDQDGARIHDPLSHSVSNLGL